ncbi:MAG: hypothetical protein OS130_02560 [Thermodesulfobacteriota bacterium]|jgi:hypothetical protein|nr:MAG: hypothetical protein OS130_02560 [Thermodesulfobacteriota bacterium]
MMRRDIALSLGLECRRFDIEAEITAKLLRALLKYWRWKPPAQ